MTTCVAIYDWENTYIWAEGRTTKGDSIVQENSNKLLQYQDYVIVCSGRMIISQLIGLWHQAVSIQLEEQIFTLRDAIMALIKDHKCDFALKDADIIIATRFGLYH